MMSVVPDLIERPVGFSYGFNMTCEVCGGVTPITADTYLRDIHHARMRCQHCDGEIWYGPNAMALRDADDLALDDDAAYRVAWYHTSSVPGWPANSRAMTPGQAEFIASRMSPDAAEGVRERHENQALHLGTYETAIESMLRKMHYEDAGGAQFWLYRVALRRDGTTLRPGYLNESREEISQATQAELGEWGVVRYLNTWESPGSISLAVRPRSLAAVQGIQLPVRSLSAGAAPRLVREVARIRDRIRQIEATRDDEPDLLEELRQRSAAARGIALPRDPTLEQQDLEESIGQLIAEEYLPGISQLVRDKFSHAMLAWSQAQEPEPDDPSFINRFSLMATALTQPGNIQRALDAEAPRML
jgi:hypothetical protein